MSYLLNYKGVKIHAKTADEAVELARKLAGEQTKSPKKRERLDTQEVSPSDQIASFWRDIETDGKQVLAILAARPDGVVTDKLAELAHVKSEDLKYILRKIHTKARTHGLDPDSVISSERVYVDRCPKSKYSMKGTIGKLIQPIASAKQPSAAGN